MSIPVQSCVQFVYPLTDQGKKSFESWGFIIPFRRYAAGKGYTCALYLKVYSGSLANELACCSVGVEINLLSIEGQPLFFRKRSVVKHTHIKSN